MSLYNNTNVGATNTFVEGAGPASAAAGFYQGCVAEVPRALTGGSYADVNNMTLEACGPGRYRDCLAKVSNSRPARCSMWQSAASHESGEGAVIDGVGGGDSDDGTRRRKFPYCLKTSTPHTSLRYITKERCCHATYPKERRSAAAKKERKPTLLC